MATAPVSRDPVDTWFPPGFEYLFEEHPYKVAKGGRGSAKSWSFARALLLLATQYPKRVLCARELQNSITESVHHLLSDQIDLMGLSNYFDVQQQNIYRKPYRGELEWYGRHGSQFFFYGIKSNPAKIKSAEGIDYCWVEEAEKVSEESWEKLIPTIRKPGSEIWITFNPDEENDPTYQRFVINTPPGCQTLTFNWQENPWFTEKMRAEKDYLYRVDPEAALHVWGGECRRNASSQILRGKYIIDSFDRPPRNEVIFREQGWDGPYFGADWGFSQDPACLVKLWVKDYKYGESQGKLFVEYDNGGIGIELDDLPATFKEVPDSQDYIIRADSSRPETISHVARKGPFRIEPAEKWEGSVEDGVSFLRSFEQIIIHPRCEATATEAKLYSFKVDRLTKDVLTDIVDKHNHRMDAIRYALQPLIMAGSTLGTWIRCAG